MRIKGLRAIYPSPRTRRPALEHRGYHDLLEKVRVTRPNQAWAAGITYIPMVNRFLPGGRHGMKQPVCGGLEVVRQLGHRLLY